MENTRVETDRVLQCFCVVRPAMMGNDRAFAPANPLNPMGTPVFPISGFPELSGNAGQWNNLGQRWSSVLSEVDSEFKTKSSQFVQPGEPFFRLHAFEDQIEWLSVGGVDT
jgi:hypothetical protein